MVHDGETGAASGLPLGVGEWPSLLSAQCKHSKLAVCSTGTHLSHDRAPARRASVQNSEESSGAGTERPASGLVGQGKEGLDESQDVKPVNWDEKHRAP